MDRFHDTYTRIGSTTVLWGSAIVLWGILDLAISLYGLYGVTLEQHPLYLPVIRLLGHQLPRPWLYYRVPIVLTGWKLVTLAGFYLLYRLVPPDWKVGVPIGLSGLGAIVVVYNLFAIVG